MMDKCIADMMVQLHTSSMPVIMKQLLYMEIRNLEVAVGVHVYVYK